MSSRDRVDGGPLIGVEIDGYTIVSPLGAGGLGDVFLAEDLALGRRVALTLLPAAFTTDADRVRRFTQEARAASSLNHPHIITVHRIGELEGRRYIATELIDGETLRARIDRGPVPIAESVVIAIQVAGALAAAHDAGIVHGAITPEKVMIRRDGYAKVLDFGLATGGAADARADIFSLSAVLHEMVTGTLPIESMGDSHSAGRPAVKVAHVAQPSPGLTRILSRGLAANPAHRYQRIEELVNDLEALRAPATTQWRARLRRWRVRLSVAALAILTMAAGWTAFRPMPSAPLVASLAVLPLADVGGDPDLDYLGEGIAEGVISRLSQLPNLKVIARSTAFQFKGREDEPVEVGRELSVDAVLTGRVVLQRDTPEVELRLIEVGSRAVLWSERLAVRPDVATALEEDIAGRVTARLRLPSVAAAARMDPQARTFYLKGRHQLNKRTKDGLRQAQLLFDQAVARDPENALLHAGLAEAWALIGAYSVLPPADAYPRAIAAARHALELDANVGEARAALALCTFLYEWKWDEAEAEFARVTRSQPGYATAHHWYGEYLMARGRTDEAVAALHRAKDLDPLAIVIAVDIGRAYYFGRRFSEARAECARALAVSPGLVQAIECIAMVDLAERRYNDAIKEYEEVSRQGIDAGPPGLMMALAGAGRHAEAEAQLAQIGAGHHPGHPAVQLILATGFLGHRDEAFRLLEAARREHSSNLVYLKTDARADALRDDPRWAAFERQAGLN